ncbi:MAG: 2-dehydropantoate 2-reductase N-terminal domain-containing protein [Paludibacteraceae bacterium]|nr:2-dehydropantoate 2-reductase N-terminal domain-containing protein [Paludibacteraceae bacterium]
MKIIVFGSGALGSLMIHFLCKAGNDVTVVARSTADELRRNGLVVRHYLQQKTTIDHPTILENAPTDEHFDIAFSVMQGQQQKELLETFKKLNTNILVLVGNNLEAEFCQNSILENRPNLHLLFGFQNSAGHREGAKAIAARLPVTKLFVGGLHNAASEIDITTIQKAFNSKDVKITPIENMYAYYLYHVAEVMPYGYMCYKVNSNLKKLKRRDIKTIMLATKECFAYLKSTGICAMPKDEEKFYNGGIKTYAMFLLYRIVSQTILGQLMVADHCKNGIKEMIYILHKFEEWRHQHNSISMPTWDKISQYMPEDNNIHY